LAVSISTRSEAALNAVWPLSPAMNRDWISALACAIRGEVVADERSVNAGAASDGRRR
jgi:hypothetical protein